MELIAPKGAELERLRSEDPAKYAWIDELPNIHNLGELLQLFYLHEKRVKFVSITLPPQNQPLTETDDKEPQ